MDSVGMNTFYQLKEVHDVAQEVITGAQAQILGGIGMLAMGLCFPPSLVVIAPVASAMISEGPLRRRRGAVVPKARPNSTWRSTSKARRYLTVLACVPWELSALSHVYSSAQSGGEGHERPAQAARQQQDNDHHLPEALERHRPIRGGESPPSLNQVATV